MVAQPSRAKSPAVISVAVSKVSENNVHSQAESRVYNHHSENETTRSINIQVPTGANASGAQPSLVSAVPVRQGARSNGHRRSQLHASAAKVIASRPSSADAKAFLSSITQDKYQSSQLLSFEATAALSQDRERHAQESDTTSAPTVLITRLPTILDRNWDESRKHGEYFHDARADDNNSSIPAFGIAIEAPSGPADVNFRKRTAELTSRSKPNVAQRSSVLDNDESSQHVMRYPASVKLCTDQAQNKADVLTNWLLSTGQNFQGVSETLRRYSSAVNPDGSLSDAQAVDAASVSSNVVIPVEQLENLRVSYQRALDPMADFIEKQSENHAFVSDSQADRIGERHSRLKHGKYGSDLNTKSLADQRKRLMRSRKGRSAVHVFEDYATNSSCQSEVKDKSLFQTPEKVLHHGRQGDLESQKLKLQSSRPLIRQSIRQLADENKRSILARSGSALQALNTGLSTDGLVQSRPLAANDGYKTYHSGKLDNVTTRAASAPPLSRHDFDSMIEASIGAPMIHRSIASQHGSRQIQSFKTNQGIHHHQLTINVPGSQVVFSSRESSPSTAKRPGRNALASKDGQERPSTASNSQSVHANSTPPGSPCVGSATPPRSSNSSRSVTPDNSSRPRSGRSTPVEMKHTDILFRDGVEFQRTGDKVERDAHEFASSSSCCSTDSILAESFESAAMIGASEGDNKPPLSSSDLDASNSSVRGFQPFNVQRTEIFNVMEDGVVKHLDDSPATSGNGLSSSVKSTASLSDAKIEAEDHEQNYRTTSWTQYLQRNRSSTEAGSANTANVAQAKTDSRKCTLCSSMGMSYCDRGMHSFVKQQLQSFQQSSVGARSNSSAPTIQDKSEAMHYQRVIDYSLQPDEDDSVARQGLPVTDASSGVVVQDSAESSISPTGRHHTYSQAFATYNSVAPGTSTLPGSRVIGHPKERSEHGHSQSALTQKASTLKDHKLKAQVKSSTVKATRFNEVCANRKMNTSMRQRRVNSRLPTQATTAGNGFTPARTSSSSSLFVSDAVFLSEVEKQTLHHMGVPEKLQDAVHYAELMPPHSKLLGKAEMVRAQPQMDQFRI